MSVVPPPPSTAATPGLCPLLPPPPPIPGSLPGSTGVPGRGKEPGPRGGRGAVVGVVASHLCFPRVDHREHPHLHRAGAVPFPPAAGPGEPAVPPLGAPGEPLRPGAIPVRGSGAGGCPRYVRCSYPREWGGCGVCVSPRPEPGWLELSLKLCWSWRRGAPGTGGKRALRRGPRDRVPAAFPRRESRYRSPGPLPLRAGVGGGGGNLNLRLSVRPSVERSGRPRPSAL